MVLIAQLSTALGARAPLTNIADQVFLELARSIEAQGVGRKVVADMFGLALRTYQKKVQRLEEGIAQQERTLWNEVYEYLADNGRATRRKLFEHFDRETPEILAAVVNDLVNSGLIFRTGRGPSTIYGLTDPQAHHLFVEEQGAAGRAALVWVGVYRFASSTAQDLADQLRMPIDDVEAALETLQSEGKVAADVDADGNERFTAPVFVVPVGASEGWEAAVFDHYQAVVNAIASKLQSGQTQSRHKDRVGGATLSFDVHDHHPHADEVYALLARVRADVNEVWDRVVAHNKAHPVDEDERVKVTFYFGQFVTDPSENGDEEAS